MRRPLWQRGQDRAEFTYCTPVEHTIRPAFALQYSTPVATTATSTEGVSEIESIEIRSRSIGSPFSATTTVRKADN